MEENTETTIQQKLMRLYSKDIQEIKAALSDLRIDGEAGVVFHVFNLMRNDEFDELKSDVLKFLADVKDAKAIEYYIQALTDDEYRLYYREILECCWLSGLDFSDYLAVFVDLFLEEEFLIAFEAYTVILNLTPKSGLLLEELGKIKDFTIVDNNKLNLKKDIITYFETHLG